MRRDDVPEERPLRDPELVERPSDDRRRCLGRTGPRQLTLGSERDPGDAGASVSGRLPDEEEVGVAALLEIGNESLAEERRTRPTGVLVEGRPDAGVGEPLDEVRGG